MAIQFYCPYCTAAIKVPDASAGKKGRCPKCETEVLIPRVKPPAEAAPASPDRAAPARGANAANPSPAPTIEADPLPRDRETPAQNEPASTIPVPAMPAASPPQAVPVDSASGDPEAQPDGFLSTEAPLVSERPAPVAALVRRRRRRSTGRWWIPLICAAALAGVCLWLLQREQPRLEGELRAEVVSGFEIPPQSVPTTLIEADPVVRSDMLEALAGNPERVISPGIMAAEFRGSDEGLLVGVEPAPASELVRVRVSADPQLVAFRRGHAEELLRFRRRDLAEAASDFCRDWQRAAKENVPLEAGKYLVRLGLTATVVSLGHHVQAVAGQKIYPCAYEDTAGSLYFILPLGTSKFRLEGRKLADGRMLFPGRYAVRIDR